MGKKTRRLIGSACVAALSSLTGRAHANLTINTTFDGTVTGLSNGTIVMNAFNYAALQFQNLYADPITLNITVASTSSVGALGGSGTNLEGFYSYTTVRNGLISDSKTANDATAVGTLPVSDPSGGHLYATSAAQMKALGLSPVFPLPPSDGTYTFGINPTGSGNYPNNYTFDPVNRQAAGKFDFIGVCEHEISEIMGRIPGLGTDFGDGGPDYMPFDLFSYSGAGTRNLTTGAGRYFSINSGTTNLKNFNNAAALGGDPQDWASGTNDAFNAFSGSGVQNNMTPVDVTAMDVIGYDLTNLVWTGATDHTTWDVFNLVNWNSGGATKYTDAALVVFDDTSVGGNNVVLNQTVFPTSVTVNSNVNNYTIGGTGVIAGLGSLTKSGSSTLTISNSNTYTGPTTVNGGVLTLASTGLISSPSITVASGATMNVNGSLISTATVSANGTVNFGGTTGLSVLNRFLSALNIGSFATASVTPSVHPSTPTVLRPAVLSFGTGASLNLTNNELITAGTETAAKSAIVAGQIFTTAPGGVLGYMNAGGGNIEIRFTFRGDANLDGTINTNDFNLLAANFNQTGRFWASGDFNFDGTVNSLDFNAVATNFGLALGGSDLDLTTLVPEPASMSLLLPIVLARRARRKIASTA